MAPISSEVLPRVSKSPIYKLADNTARKYWFIGTGDQLGNLTNV
jgi:hypothetical protein